jgi:transposase
MFGIGPATRIYLAAEATDMRKGFEGLYGLARDRLNCEPLSGHVFLFSNAKRNRLKMLFWGVSRMQVETCSAVLKMGEGLPESAFRSRLQTARSCCVQKAWW